MIEVQELTVSIGEMRILRDVNLRIETGSVAVLHCRSVNPGNTQRVQRKPEATTM